MCTPSGYIYKIDTVHVIFTDARDENHDSDDTETLASPSLASPDPSLEGGRVWRHETKPVQFSVLRSYIVCMLLYVGLGQYYTDKHAICSCKLARA